jgi:hypothetical protein
MYMCIYTNMHNIYLLYIVLYMYILYMVILGYQITSNNMTCLNNILLIIN